MMYTFKFSNAPLKESRDFLQHLQQSMLMPRKMSKVLAVASKCTSNLAFWGSILGCHTIHGEFCGNQRTTAGCCVLFKHLCFNISDLYPGGLGLSAYVNFIVSICICITTHLTYSSFIHSFAYSVQVYIRV